MALRLRFGRFDLQVRLVLALLLLFLAALDLLNIFLLAQARAALERVERDRAVARAGEAAAAVGLDRPAATVEPGGVLPTVSPTALRRAAVRLGYHRLAVLDGEGRELVASGPSLSAAEEAGSVLSPDARAALQAGRATTGPLIPERGGADARIDVYLPVLDRGGRLLGVLAATRPVPELGQLVARYRLVLAVQVGGVLLIAAVVLVFANWVSRPYRRLAAVAGEAGVARREIEAFSEPDELTGAFRAVVEKLRTQEETLTAVSHEGGGVGDVVRFANQAASGMGTGVLVVDRRARVAALNPAAAALLDLPRERAIGLAVGEAVVRVSGLAERVGACLRDGRASSREVLDFRDATGHPGHVGVSISPAGGFEDRVAGALVLMTDLTEIRELQEQARLRENLAAVGKLSAGIAHELRNALSTILGYARMLEKNDDPGVRLSAEEILREIDSVRATVDEFLAYARPPEPARRRVSVEEVLRGCAGTVADYMDVSVEGVFGEVLADEGLLRRAFGNLLRNAADAVGDPDRRVRVVISGREVASGRAVQIDVEDDGPGVPPEERDQVFVPFYTTRSRGTGLGLALVHRTLVDLGGTIELDQSPRLGGARFRIRLPRPA